MTEGSLSNGGYYSLAVTGKQKTTEVHIQLTLKSVDGMNYASLILRSTNKAELKKLSEDILATYQRFCQLANLNVPGEIESVKKP